MKNLAELARNPKLLESFFDKDDIYELVNGVKFMKQKISNQR